MSSILPGYTKNPYALDRVTAGSSGGTAAAVAANFGEVGLGTDTGNSIRGPSSHQALVGIRSTMGLTSRAGVVPLNLVGRHRRPDGAHRRRRRRRVPGRSPATIRPIRSPRAARGRTGARLRDVARRATGSSGARIGVLHQAYDRAERRPRGPATSSAPRSTTCGAPGATVVDPRASMPELDSHLPRARGGSATRSSTISSAGSRRSGDRAPVKTLDEIIAVPPLPSVDPDAARARRRPPSKAPEQSPGCKASRAVPRRRCAPR